MEDGKERYVVAVQSAMLAVNFLAVAFICVVIYRTSELIRAHYDARVFLDSVETIPVNPRRNLIVCMTLMAILVATFAMRLWRHLPNRWNIAA